VLPHIPAGVQVLPNLLGCIDKLRYADQDVKYTDKFPEFENKCTQESKGTGPSGDPILEPKQWITGLYNTGVMNLLEIPHFGRGKDVNNYVKQLTGSSAQRISLDG
jgi:hypothetical protein